MHVVENIEIGDIVELAEYQDEGTWLVAARHYLWKYRDDKRTYDAKPTPDGFDVVNLKDGTRDWVHGRTCIIVAKATRRKKK